MYLSVVKSAMAAGMLLGGAAPAPAPAPASLDVAVSNSDLAVVRLDPDPVKPGGKTTVHAFVANLGPDRTASPFSVIVVLPWPAKAEGPYFPTSCQPIAAGSAVVCTFPAGLSTLRTATALIPARVPLGTLSPQTLIGGMIMVVSADDQNQANNITAYSMRVAG
ncbi:hypothetical protein [Kitasatospora sp. GP82]|uniref:hypothetical protein n=1 Tax=Kitasatospora sp. GP82 TaxID=3035089 RepID=UPI0024771BB7|nr:hypothetical protein [Kitasatospora sp. GP82]MDH6126168.1 hypothetical protein [Kitasatospora sp. GP82]